MSVYEEQICRFLVSSIILLYFIRKLINGKANQLNCQVSNIDMINQLKQTEKESKGMPPKSESKFYNII